MTVPTLLSHLFHYKAGADEELFVAMRAMDEEAHAAQRRAALLILSHAHVVDRIFAANLQRLQHGYTTTDPDEPLALDDLSNAARETDSWYVDYGARLTPTELDEMLDFQFSDGGEQGRMSRAEMLAHVITHGGYHRGEVGRILLQLSIARPRDIFTGYLHKTEPARRQQSSLISP